MSSEKTIDPQTKARISELITSSPIVLFMKGNRRMPQCGFSATVVQILDQLVPEYKTVDVLQDPAIREGIKAYSEWPTIPQLYVKGEFLGGCDIVKQMYAQGELHEKLGTPRAEVKPPRIAFTEAAAKEISAAAANAPGEALHLSVNPQFQHGLEFGPREPRLLEVKTAGLSVLVDPMQAARLDGVTIDYVQGPGGAGFKIDNPNAPPPVKAITVQEMKALLDRGPVELFDVRGEDERKIAKIDAAKPLDPKETERVMGLDKNTPLYFHCHHGGRSQRAAEHFRQQGFRHVHNLTGGIDAWSQHVDPKVPRY